MIKGVDKIFIELQRRTDAHVLGYWNKSLPGTTLGTLMIFLAECRLIAKYCNSGLLDVAVDAESHGITKVLVGEYRCLNGIECEDAALSFLLGMECVDKVYACGGFKGFEALSSQLASTHSVWPLLDRVKLPAPYDTTKYIQVLFKEIGHIEPLKFTSYYREWADQTIQKHFDGLAVVGLHLKNVHYQGVASISLADASVWHTFLSKVNHACNIGFLLLGDDPVNEAILKLPNVCLAREAGADSFGKHMALLGQCDGFMGMMSALANMALFSFMPYAIFKNPDHHRDEMLLEIGTTDHYSFATEEQKVLRVNETPEILMSELERMSFIKGKRC
jgi:hypothetical protein